MKIMREMAGTLIGLAVATAIVLSATLTGFDLVRLNLEFLERLAKHHVDDGLAALSLVAIGLAVDFWRRNERHGAQLEAQKLRTLQATMRTVQDIVNNFLNNLLLFQMEAEPYLSADSSKQMEDLIQETQQKLKALGDLEIIREKRMGAGAGIEYPEPGLRMPTGSGKTVGRKDS